MIYVLSGGGNGLNFRVFSGTTAPSNPKLYDIWIKTSVAPTQIRFINNGTPASVGNPGVTIIKYDGDVWWSTTCINVIGDKNKSNGVPVYMYAKLTSCYQSKTIDPNTGTAPWELVDAYYYKNSQWVQFSSEWWLVNTSSVVVQPTMAKAPADASGTYTYDMSNGAKVTCASGAKTYCCMYWVIDASKYTTITFTAVSSNGANTCTTWDVSTNLNGDFGSDGKLKNVLRNYSASGTDTKSLDITNYTGTLYLRFGFHSGLGGASSTLTITDARCT